jgi:hypothetical protein
MIVMDLKIRWPTVVIIVALLIISLYALTEVNYYSYKNVAERHLLLPIPELEMSVNKAITKNNPGWE